MKRLLTRTLSVLLCLSLILGLGGRWTIPLPTEAASIDVGSNPRPKIDIAVNVPSDYPGTFLDFKEELAQKLIDQGVDISDFRITNTAVTIDTTDLNGWYVYDHYYNKATYDNLKLSAEQQLKQPFRQADNTHTTGVQT